MFVGTILGDSGPLLIARDYPRRSLIVCSASRSSAASCGHVWKCSEFMTKLEKHQREHFFTHTF